ncbi:MAG: ATP-dependent zinc metalloprotease FtsH [SAR324 cluster bacterium]|nr:ATP-dependent zinc metalloprotease FtsH [SAR324 cluster bacterium]
MNNFMRNLGIWLVIGMVMLLLFNVLGNRQSQERHLSFSDFIAQVESGSVLEVALHGRQVIGVSDANGRFQTQVPNYPALFELLERHQVRVRVEPPDQGNLFLAILNSWLPMLLIIGIWLFFMRQVQSGGNRAMSFGKVRARMLEKDENAITFADVQGIDEAREEVSEIVDFLSDPQKFEKLGGEIPRGVLLMGDPGSGKTLLAKAIAGEAGVPFFSISGSDFVEMFVGVGASRVRDLFEQGKKNSPCIIFIDEIDAVGRSRGAGLGGGNDEREQTLNQLLVEMDGFEPTDGIIVIAATNRPDVLDSALLRPGRFDRQVHVPLPDVKGREAILQIHAAKVLMAEDVELNIVARGTPGFSGADLKNLVNEAALGAARHNKTALTLVDFEWARDKILMGPERKSMVMKEEERRITAYHEAGHALVSVLLPKTDPVHKVTIVPRGRAMGVTAYLPEQDYHSYKQDYLQHRLIIAMGGRAAEEIIFDEITTGASNDIQQATEMARNMITRWGMSEALGPIVLDTDDQQIVFGREIGAEREYSEDTAEKIDEELRTLIARQYERATQLLRDNIGVLHRVAELLLEEEVLDGSRIVELVATPGTPVLQPEG